MPKKDIHPEWYDNTEVYCDGKLVYTVSSTKEKLNVDIWSGNHPFYTGSKKLLDTSLSRGAFGTSTAPDRLVEYLRAISILFFTTASIWSNPCSNNAACSSSIL